ncbi:hypothetical protein FJZ55_00805 [Candidatus Woesearchaeota archaeon]|nr:hypothetical protein [Candidatus Woesearchaeota archaeon]
MFELDGGNHPILLDSYGISSVSRVQPGVSRVVFTNPEKFVSGAYVGLLQDELGNAPSEQGVMIIHGTTSSAGVTAGGASASCDIAAIGFNAGNVVAPSHIGDSPNSAKARIHAAFFCLRSDSNKHKMRVANYCVDTQNMGVRGPSGTSGGTVLVQNAGIAPDGTNTAVGVLLQPNGLGVRKYIQAEVGGIISGNVNGKVWNGSIYVKSGNDPSRVLQGASANVILYDNHIVGGGGHVVLNTDTGVTGGTPPVLGFKVENAGNGWWRVSSSIGASAAAAGTRTLYFGLYSNPFISSQNETNWSGNGSIEFYVWGAQLQEGTVATPYIRTPFTSTTNNTPTDFVLGNQDLLINPYPGTKGLGVGSRQNLFKHSEGFTNGYWTKTNIGVSAGGYTAPNGTTTAMKLHELDTNAGLHKSIYAIPLPSAPIAGNGNYTVSIFAKEAERKYLSFVDSNSAAFDRFVVDLTTGRITENSLDLSAKTIPYGNGWWRVVVSHRTPITTGTQSFGFAPHLGATLTSASSRYGPIDAGVSGSGILIWGAQLEQGTVFGEYTPTGAAVAGTTYTRLAGNTYSSTVTGIGNRGEATAWGTIVIPPIASTSSPVCAYLENSYGVAGVTAHDNSMFDLSFTKKMASNMYCVITGTEQETTSSLDGLLSGLSANGSIPPTDEYTLNLLRDSTANTQKTRDGFTITCLRQVPPSPYIPLDTAVSSVSAGDATYKILKEHTTNSSSPNIYLNWESLITSGSYWYRLKVQRNRAGATADLQDAFYTSFYDYRVPHTGTVHDYHKMKYDISDNVNNDKYIISGVASTSAGVVTSGGGQTLELKNFEAYNRNCHFNPRSVHYQRGRTQRIHFIVFGGKQINDTP